MSKRAELTFLDNTSDFEQSGCRCIRTYYLDLTRQLAGQHQDNFTGRVSPVYDKPNQGACIWQDIYRFAASQDFNPLTGLEYLYRISHIRMSAINLRSVLQHENTEQFRKHGCRLTEETRASIISSVEQIKTMVLVQRELYGLMPVATISELSNVSGLDPVIELLARDSYRVPASLDLCVKARIYYARTPVAYNNSDYPEQWRADRRLVRLFTGGNDGNSTAPAVDGLLDFIRNDMAVDETMDQSTKP